MKSKAVVFILAAFLTVITAPTYADDPVILNPGTVSGSVSLTGYQIKSVTVYAVDTLQQYSGQVTVNVPAGADSIDYVLTLEGDGDYYLRAEAIVSDPNYIMTLFPVSGPVYVPVGGNVTHDISMEPAIITGKISTGSNSNTIERYYIYAYVSIPEFYYPPYRSFYNYIYVPSLNIPGETGTTYSMLVAPEISCDLRAYIYIDDIEYYYYDSSFTTPASGISKYRDYTIDVSAANISGKTILNGINVTNGYMDGRAYSPTRYNTVTVEDISTGLYNLNVDAGSWRIRPEFNFKLPGDLSHLTGYLDMPLSDEIDINDGDHLTDIDFIINPGFIPGKLNVWGANTKFQNAYLRAYKSSLGYSQSYIDPETGKFLFVCSPGDWEANYYIYMRHDYPEDPDSSLYSYIYLYNTSSSTITRTVEEGKYSPSYDPNYGTITVRNYFYVADEGELKSPYIIATRHESPSSYAYGYGSSSLTTEGQAIVTLLLPGTYTIESFANVNGSDTEFGTVEVTVDEGDVVVIGGTESPIIKVTNPTNNQIIDSNKVTIEGTVTDDEGVATICINGEYLIFDPNDKVDFSHEIELEYGENIITIIATDTDGNPPVTLTLKVFRPSSIDIYPNRTPNEVDLSKNNTIYVAVLGAADFNVADVNSSKVKFGRTGKEAIPVRDPLIRDLNKDGFNDAMFGFMTFDCGFQLGDTKGVLIGETKDGISIKGEDSVVVSN